MEGGRGGRDGPEGGAKWQEWVDGVGWLAGRVLGVGMGDCVNGEKDPQMTG